jgi:hypothetical protein
MELQWETPLNFPDHPPVFTFVSNLSHGLCGGDFSSIAKREKGDSMKVGKKNLVWWVYDRFGRILLSNGQKMVVHHARYVRIVHVRSSLSSNTEL